MPGSVEDGESQRNPFFSLPIHEITHDPFIRFIHLVHTGKQAGRVAVIAHAQQSQIKTWERSPAEKSSHLDFIKRGRLFHGQAAVAHGKDLGGRDANFREQVFLGHAEIAGGVGEGNMPLVHPKQEGLGPGHQGKIRLLGKLLKQNLRGISPGEGRHKPAPGIHRFPGYFHDPGRGFLEKKGGRGINF